MTTATFTQTAFGVTTSDNCKNGMEMLKEAGGDFNVELKQLYYPKVTQVGIDDTITTYEPIQAWNPVRDDTGESISNSTVSDGFTVVQNAQVIELIDVICQNHDLDYRTMAVGHNGSSLAVQLECPHLSQAFSFGEEHQALFTVTNGHDGKGSLRTGLVIKRMKCMNMLNAIHKEMRANKVNHNNSSFTIRHTKNMADRIVAMIQSYKQVMGEAETMVERMELLSTTKCSKLDRIDLYEMVLLNGTAKDELGKRGKTLFENQMRELQIASENPVNQVKDDFKGTIYEALQPLSYFATHNNKPRNSKHRGNMSDAEQIFHAQHDGPGMDFGSRSFLAAYEMALAA